MQWHFLSVFVTVGLLVDPAYAQMQPAPPAAVRNVRLPKGTPVRVRMDYGVSAKAARVGDPVYLKVVRAVMSKDLIVIPEGSLVTGRVVEASPPGGGRPGALVIDMEFVAVSDGRIRLAGSTADRGSARATTVNEGMLTVPLGSGSGKNANIPAGTEFTAYTDRDY